MSSGGSLKLKIKFPTFGQNQPEKGAAGSEGQHKKRKREPGAPGPSQPAASQPGKPAKTARSAQSGLPDPPRFQTNLQASPEPSPPQQRRDIYRCLIYSSQRSSCSPLDPAPRPSSPLNQHSSQSQPSGSSCCRSDRDKAAAAALKLRLGSNAAASTSQLSGTNVTANHAALQPARGSSAAQQGSTQQQRPTVSLYARALDTPHQLARPADAIHPSPYSSATSICVYPRSATKVDLSAPCRLLPLAHTCLPPTLLQRPRCSVRAESNAPWPGVRWPPCRQCAARQAAFDGGLAGAGRPQRHQPTQPAERSASTALQIILSGVTPQRCVAHAGLTLHPALSLVPQTALLCAAGGSVQEIQASAIAILA